MVTTPGERTVPRVSSRRSTLMITRQCKGLYDGNHGCHAWFTINPATGKAYRRGRVVWFCSGTYPKPAPSILPQNLESSVRSHRG